MIPFSPNPVHSSKVTPLSSSLSYFIKKQLLLFFLLLIAAGCATSPKQPSPTAVEANKIKHELDTLTQLYEKKDTRFFSHMHLAGVAPPLFKGSALFKESIQHDFDTFSEIKMNIKITQIEIKQDAISTGIYWEGAWKMNNDAPPLKQSGNALFIFSREPPSVLMEIRGESPFGVFQKNK